jgi:hypothetical protein
MFCEYGNVTEASRARPIAPLVRELRLAGRAHLAIGVTGLAAALWTIDSPARAAILFAVAAVVIGGAGWARSAWIPEAEARAPDPSAMRESRSDTRRRTTVVAVPAAVLVGAALLIGGGLGALVAGVVAGTGVGELRGAHLARRRAEGCGAEIWRELGRHPFTGQRRPLYTLPRSASTLRT